MQYVHASPQSGACLGSRYVIDRHCGTPASPGAAKDESSSPASVPPYPTVEVTRRVRVHRGSDELEAGAKKKRGGAAPSDADVSGRATKTRTSDASASAQRVVPVEGRREIVKEVPIMEAFADALKCGRYAECRDLILKAEAIDEEQMRCGISNVSSGEVQTNIVYQLLMLPSSLRPTALLGLIDAVISPRSRPSETDLQSSDEFTASDLLVFGLHHLPRCCPCLRCVHCRQRTGEEYVCVAPLQGIDLKNLLSRVGSSAALVPCVEALLSDDWAGSDRFGGDISALTSSELRSLVDMGSIPFQIARQLLKKGVDPNRLWSQGIPRDHLDLMLEMSDPLLPSSQRFRAEDFCSGDVSILHLMLRLYRPAVAGRVERTPASGAFEGLETYATAEQIRRMMAILHDAIGREATDVLISPKRSDPRRSVLLPLLMTGVLTPASPLWSLVVNDAVFADVNQFFPATNVRCEILNERGGRLASETLSCSTSGHITSVRTLLSAGLEVDTLLEYLGGYLRSESSDSLSHDLTTSLVVDQVFLGLLLDAGADEFHLHELVVLACLVRNHVSIQYFTGSVRTLQTAETALRYMWCQTGISPNTRFRCRQLSSSGEPSNKASAADAYPVVMEDSLPLLHIAVLCNSSTLLRCIANHNKERLQANGFSCLDDVVVQASADDGGSAQSDADVRSAGSPEDGDATRLPQSQSDYLRCMAARRERLLAMGCYDTSAVDANGRTALHAAVLLCLGAPSGNGFSPGSYDATLYELIREVFPPKQAPRQHSTPHSQHGRPNPPVPTLLPGLECDLTAKDDDGNTPYDLVVQCIRSLKREQRASMSTPDSGQPHRNGGGTVVATINSRLRRIRESISDAAEKRRVPITFIQTSRTRPFVASRANDEDIAGNAAGHRLAAQVAKLRAKNALLTRLLAASGCGAALSDTESDDDHGVEGSSGGDVVVRGDSVGLVRMFMTQKSSASVASARPVVARSEDSSYDDYFPSGHSDYDDYYDDDSMEW